MKAQILQEVVGDNQGNQNEDGDIEVTVKVKRNNNTQINTDKNNNLQQDQQVKPANQRVEQASRRRLLVD